ncbi:MAG: hypothetical protein CMP76_14775 [Flavobacterium sp.]|uniref:hypothetical protein n=1 Tax=Flavobacterium sp. TaxID=239 RepID=UPI000C42C793|nr:hypothetical protein [Flavobacterium sp.]MBF04547.1 hypothetical protein [Flavobacterium sp.]|tara:strand:- start:161 stop:553 length:393 start_codon:yes stop_codon:yes gene_type:complete
MIRTILILFLLSLSGCNNKTESLELENRNLKVENDSLKKKIEYNKSYWFPNKTASQKNANVEDSLRKKVELIPLKPTLGGKMEFGKIEMINENWIIADYSDGHVEGTSIWKYKVTENGKVEFLLINSVEP